MGTPHFSPLCVSFVFWGCVCCLDTQPTPNNANEAIVAALSVFSQTVMGHVPRDSPAFECLHRALELFRQEAPAVDLPLQTNEPSLNVSEKAPTVMEQAHYPMQDVPTVPSGGTKYSISHNAFPPSEPAEHSRMEKMDKLKSPAHPVTSPPRFPP